MKYVYDILLNFNETRIYDFFEWRPEDDIEYFKKVSILKINSDSYRKVAVGARVADEALLNKIYNTAEIYDKKQIRYVEYLMILTNGSEAVGVLLNKMGRILMISKLLLDEEEEVFGICNTQDEKALDITASNIESNNTNNYLTRYEGKKLFFLNKELEGLYFDKNLVKLKYLYYECFRQIENDIETIYDRIKTFINDEWSTKHNELYNLVRLSYSKK
ncbi:MAG: DUF3603 family protein [Bacilli bacterium]|nr:DUF3603 family protein [Bacilli bacterium]MDD3304549.1 DUF3603 family protein [Bacilli bacterium]MDD4411298.1 DUF3603 family protein [Bacilli bacterium]